PAELAKVDPIGGGRQSAKVAAPERPAPASALPSTPPRPADGSAEDHGTESSGAQSSATPHSLEEFQLDEAEQKRVVSELLGRYDYLVTQLAILPAVSADRNSPARLEWARLVPSESALHNSVLDQLVNRRLTDGTRLLPGPDGVSFRHHVERTSTRDDGSIEFSWCGYSPGIRINATTGAVVDDEVAHIRGVGRADRDQWDNSVWILDAFDQLDLNVLPAGSGDPCDAGADSP
ncbi:MAG TPA: hypothetical protein VL068_08335, partial [Microthrixaceae bacterium]|nr:hypothetical protein [Microthrixaceae bacterium]